MNFNYKLLNIILLLKFCAVIVVCEKSDVIENDLNSNSSIIVVRDLKGNFIEKNRYTYIFNGLQKYESVPVRFPKDICLMKIHNVTYAASLYSDGEGGIYFVVFKYKDHKFQQIYHQSTPLAISMDCKEFNSKGYIAVAYNLTSRPEILKNGSPVFEMENDKIEIIQYFAEPHLTSVQFNIRGNSLFLFKTHGIEAGSEMKSNCPIYKLDDTHFDLINRIPCKNSRRVAIFTINSKLFIAIANYADEYNRTDTESHIYKYDIEENSFKLFQKIETFAVVDVDYFHVHKNDEEQHFLVFANSKQKGTTTEEDSSEAYSVIYKYENDNFIPFQKLLLYEVQQFLQVQSGYGEFMLLVACDDQDIKLFQYDGWKFEESAVQLTEGALGKGISNMRYFDDLNETYIIIANENMLLNEPNIFIPIYKKQENASDIKDDILNWSKQIYENHSKININKLKEKLQSMRVPTEIVFDDSTYIKFKKARIEKAFVNKIIYSKKNFTQNFWNNITKAKQLLENIKLRTLKLIRKSNLNNSKNTTDTEKISTAKDKNDNIALESQHNFKNQSELENLSIKNLIVKSNIKINNINGISIKKGLIKIKQINAKKISINHSPPSERKVRQIEQITQNESLKEEYVNLVVNKLNITNHVNEINLNLLYDNLLKKVGDQTISSSVTIRNLTANSVASTNRLINDWNTSKLVLTNKGRDFVVNQDIQFTAPLKANNVNIKNRINNIHIVNDKLDVLLLNSNETQKITGVKTFNEIDLLEPIHIGGKIIGSQVSKVSPLNPIHGDFTIEGDYTIFGDVTIEKQLSTKNIFGITSKNTVDTALNQGLKLNEAEIPFRINFPNKITTNNLNISIINNVNAQNFVKIEFENVQRIEALKIFVGNLNIEGNSNITNINQINLQTFENGLLKISEDQNITKSVHINKLIIPSINSNKINFGTTNLSNILNKANVQHILGKITIQNLLVKNISIENLASNRTIFGEQINTFQIEKMQREKIANSLNLSKVELFDNIKIKNLELKKSLNQLSINIIEALVKKLDEKISLIGPIDFGNDMEILKLQFNGKLNGIPEKEFGRTWLIRSSSQNFTAAQHLKNTQTPNANILGTINNIPITNFYNNTYWLNRNEIIDELNFNSTVIGNKIYIKNFNQEKFPDDFLIANASSFQKINDILSADNIFVKGILNLMIVNNLNFKDFENYMKEKINKVAVHHVSFDKMPIIKNFNGKNIKNLMEQIWLKNTDISTISKRITFTNAKTKVPLDLKNYLNNVNISYVKEHYINTNELQRISGNIKFLNYVSFENELKASHMDLNGNITTSYYDSEISFNLNQFSKNILKLNDEQAVFGQWNAHQVYVEGDLNDVSLNGLHLYDDVMRYDTMKLNMTGKKYFESLKIEKIYTDGDGAINSVNISNWIHNSVFIYDNFTIYGQTTIDKSIIYNNINVIGLVNGIKFTKEALLLKSNDQNIKETNLKIITKNFNKQEILSNTIKHLTTKNINGRNVEKLLKNINQNINNITIKSGDLVFENILNIENFNSNDYFFDLNTKEYFNQLTKKNLEAKAEIIFDNLNNKIEIIKANYEDLTYYLKTFGNVQTIYGNVKKIVSWTALIGSELHDYIVLLNGHKSKSQLSFYTWNIKQKLFVKDSKLSWNAFPDYYTVTNIDKILLNGQDYLVIETHFEHKFYQNIISLNENGLVQKYELYNNSSWKYLQNNYYDVDTIINCFYTYSRDDSIISELCLIDNSFVTTWSFHLPFVTQVVHISKTIFATLKADTIEIRDYSRADIIHQRISVVNPTHINVIHYKNSIYLAIVCSKRLTSIYSSSVEIYRSSDSVHLHFERLQSIQLTNPLIAKFQKTLKSDDLFLHVVTDDFAIPLAVYHYKGVIGFQQIIEKSTLPKSHGIQTFEFKGNQKFMIAMEYGKGVKIVELIFATS
ncbi:homeobox-like protein HDP1 [Condylostylus longicornis]|uniref:homeobox-like protein HDP1 n=1 Tax=Condylostylus longicornis TaxID=2530218 RepID=UPI00244E2065|nr:homeobox-like protein HDP1 [Condylostylus longicornis]